MYIYIIYIVLHSSPFHHGGDKLHGVSRQSGDSIP